MLYDGFPVEYLCRVWVSIRLRRLCVLGEGLWGERSNELAMACRLVSGVVLVAVVSFVVVAVPFSLFVCCSRRSS